MKSTKLYCILFYSFTSFGLNFSPYFYFAYLIALSLSPFHSCRRRDMTSNLMNDYSNSYYHFFAATRVKMLEIWFGSVELTSH